MTLKFNEASHRYWLDGKPVQGVTTLLSKGLPKPAIPYWAASTVAEYVIDNPEGVEQLRSMGRAPAIAALKNVPWEKRDTAAIKGTDIHALAEQIVHGNEVEVPAHLLGYVEGYARFLDTWGIEPIVTEVPIANRKHQYAGKLDVIGAMSGETWLLDWKSSKGVYGETALQTAAYAEGEFYVNQGEWDVELAMPHIDRIGVVHITEDGSHLYDLGDIAAAFKVFTHVAYLAKKTDWIKELVKEPMSEPQEGSAA